MMGDKTAIEWTDATWNPTIGCSIVSPGCTNCYAMKMAARIERMGGSGGAMYAGMTRPSKAGAVWSGKVRLVEGALDRPLQWRKPRRIFVNSMSDLFHEALSDEAIDKVFAVMALAPRHTFQVLTKRAERMRDYMATWPMDGQPDRIAVLARDIAYSFGRGQQGNCGVVARPLPNVWLGVSVEDQTRADERIPHLLTTPAAVRFLSCEPLLGPVDLRRLDVPGLGIDWVIAGGESGSGARPMHPDWARALRDQCGASGVPFFFKQWGEFGPGAGFVAEPSSRTVYRGEVQTLKMHAREIKLCIPTRDDDRLGPPLTLERFGKKLAGRSLDGRTHDAFPAAAT